MYFSLYARMSLVLVLLLAFAGCQKAIFKDIPVGEAFKLIGSDTTVVLLDVRTADEYKGEAGHLANAVLIPIQEIQGRLSELEKYKSRTIIAYCRAGHRSAKAAEILSGKGFKVLNLEGGITAWSKDKYPVVFETK